MPQVIVDKDGKKKQIFDPNDPNDMAIANDMAQKKLNLNVTVDPQPLQTAIKQKEEAEAKAEELKEKLDLVLEAQMERKLDELGITDPERRFELKANPEQLIGYAEGVKDAQKNSGRDKGGDGVLPLNQQQITGGSTPKQGFESHEAMIDYLRDLEKVGTEAEKRYAQEVIQRLTFNSLKTLKQEGKPIVYEDKDFEILKKITENKRRRELLKRQKGDWAGEA